MSSPGVRAIARTDAVDAAGYAALLRRLRADEDEVVYPPAFERDLDGGLDRLTGAEQLDRPKKRYVA